MIWSDCLLIIVYQCTREVGGVGGGRVLGRRDIATTEWELGEAGAECQQSRWWEVVRFWTDFERWRGLLMDQNLEINRRKDTKKTLGFSFQQTIKRLHFSGGRKWGIRNQTQWKQNFCFLILESKGENKFLYRRTMKWNFWVSELRIDFPQTHGLHNHGKVTELCSMFLCIKKQW